MIVMMGGTQTPDCTVSLSVFAGPERILRRFYVFVEEPRKSTITTSEPCSPVFKEVQPRPSEHSQLEFQPFILVEFEPLLYIMCFTVSYLLL